MFYLIVFIILSVLAVLNIRLSGRRGQFVPVYIAAIILVLIAGLRYETGGDWDTYTKIFYRVPTWKHLPTFDNGHLALETGFLLFVSTIKTFGGSLQTLYFIVALFDITLITKALCHYTRFPALGLLCYYGILYFSLEMIYTRQAIAVAMCFYALRYVEEKRPIRFLFWVLLALLFHRVAVVLLVLYPLLGKRFPAWAHIGIVLLGACIMAIGVPWITSIFTTISSLLGEGYATKAQEYSAAGAFSVSRSIGLGFILNILILGVLMFFKKHIEECPYGTTHINMFTLSLMLYYYCYELIEVSNRFRLFFLISIIALLPLVVEVLSERVMRIIAFCGVALYSFSFSMNILLERPQAAAYNPYQNYLIYRMEHRPSTGKARLNQSKQAFQDERH